MKYLLLALTAWAVWSGGSWALAQLDMLIEAPLVHRSALLVARGKENKSAANGVAVLNLLLGWTVLGWIGALIWAVTLKGAEVKPIAEHQRVPVAVQ